MTKEERKEYEKQRRYKLKKWFREEYLSTQRCQKCGENHPATIDFHHINQNEKEYGIARLLHDTKSKNMLLKELAKCIALCANCHRKLHYEEMITGNLEKGYNQ